MDMQLGSVEGKFINRHFVRFGWSLFSKSYTIIFKLFPFYCYSIIMQSTRTWAMQRMAYINATCVIKGSQQRQCSISIGKKISNKLTKIEIHLENNKCNKCNNHFLFSWLENTNIYRCLNTPAPCVQNVFHPMKD